MWRVAYVENAQLAMARQENALRMGPPSSDAITRILTTTPGLEPACSRNHPISAGQSSGGKTQCASPLQLSALKRMPPNCGQPCLVVDAVGASVCVGA